MTIRSTQEELSSKSFPHKRKYANVQDNTVTTRTLCLKDIISPKAAVLNVENQQQSADKALEALKLFVGNVEEKLRQKTDDLEKKAEQQKASRSSGIIQMPKGYDNRTCEKCHSTPQKEKTAGQTKRIRRSTKNTELCSWAISGGFLE